MKNINYIYFKLLKGILIRQNKFGNNNPNFGCLLLFYGNLFFCQRHSNFLNAESDYEYTLYSKYS